MGISILEGPVKDNKGIVRQDSICMEKKQNITRRDFCAGITLDTPSLWGYHHGRTFFMSDVLSTISTSAISNDHLGDRTDVSYFINTGADMIFFIQCRYDNGKFMVILIHDQLRPPVSLNLGRQCRKNSALPA